MTTPEAYKDGAALLRGMIAQALQEGKKEITLPPGEFSLHSAVRIDTPSIAHDDGCGDIHEKDVHLLLRGVSGFTIRGSTDSEGNPATLLAGCHDDPIQGRLPSILWAENCPGLTLQNLAFTRKPETAFCGTVTDTAGGVLKVRLESRPQAPAQSGAYCMNRFDRGDRRLTGESLTIGFGYDRRFIRVSDHEMALDDPALCERVRPGDGLSWHQSGLTDFLIFIGGCDRLTLDNLRVFNTNAFGLLTENCRGITARRVVMQPPPRQFFTGPRDGWKVYRCSGDISLDRCHFEGFRMDAQNVHSNYFLWEEGNKDLAVFSCKYAPVPLRTGDEIRLHFGGEEYLARIACWRFLPGREEAILQDRNSSAARAAVGGTNRITRYEVRFSSPLPDEITQALRPGSLAEPLSWEPAGYTCRRSVFRNIAGAGHLLRCRNAELSENRYEHLMNAGVLIGDELSTHCESGHGRDIRIVRCSFDDIGFKPRYGQKGCAAVAVCSQGFDTPVNAGVTVTENTFSNCARAVEIHTAKAVTLRKNRYHGIGQPLWIDPETTEPETIRREDE